MARDGLPSHEKQQGFGPTSREKTAIFGHY